jgi:hypothetical protein
MELLHTSNGNLAPKSKTLPTEVHNLMLTCVPPFLSQSVACGAFAKAGCITVLVSAEKLSLRNFWSGNWRSQFEIRFTGGTVATVTGWSKIHIHYFEDGNVQMQNSKECNHQVNFTVRPKIEQNTENTASVMCTVRVTAGRCRSWQKCNCSNRGPRKHNSGSFKIMKQQESKSLNDANTIFNTLVN